MKLGMCIGVGVNMENDNCGLEDVASVAGGIFYHRII